MKADKQGRTTGKKINRATVGLYWQQIRKFKLSFFTMLICVPLSALLLDTLLPYTLSMAVGTFSTGDKELLTRLLWLAGGIGLAGVLFNLVGFQSVINNESSVRKALVDSSLNKLLMKDQEFYSNQKIGSLTGKFIDFINGHVGLQDLFILQTLRFIFTFGTGVILIFLNSWIMGVLVLVLLAILITQVRLSIRLRTPLRTKRKEMIAEINGATADIISNNLIVKTFANEKSERSAISKLSDKYLSVYRKDFRWMSVEGTGRLFIVSFLQITSIAIMAKMLFSGTLELGAAIFIVAYFQRIASQIFSLGEIINGYDKILLQASPMTEILMDDNKIIDKPGAKKLVVTHGDIKLNNLSYRYPDSDELVLKDLELHILPGQKVGIVGKSGSGKTTLTRLLLRFDDVSSGTLKIDDQDISSITQESLRSSMAYVPQEPLLFHRTLRENIAYGKTDATEKEIRRAARQANALEFIDKLKDGLDTVVGERGVKLSGGQRQRIAIARAVLKDSPLLVLDEATSALDSESELLIQKSLETLMKGRTSIVIAHRLSTIAKLDRIVVLENGKIVEDGMHDKLLSQGGVYSKLWKHQSGGFMDE